MAPAGARLVSLENDEFRQLISTVDYPPLKASFFYLMCHCDGLYLISYPVGVGSHCALWNPSRRSYKNLNQYTFNHRQFKCGICYDPLLDDYKVVMADAEHYAVFYCRKNQWSDLREVSPNFRTCYIRGSGASLKGSIYWVSFVSREGRYEIVCFDGRDEKWKKVGVNVRADLELISSG